MTLGTWLILQNKLPTPSGIEELPAPSAYTVLDHLVSGDKTKRLPGSKTRETEDHQERTSQGMRGTKELGYRWCDITHTETSALPVRVEVELVGVAGIELTWHFSLEHVGQAGHAGFQHGAPRARFADAAAQGRFAAVFREHFAVEPTWADAK